MSCDSSSKPSPTPHITPAAPLGGDKQLSDYSVITQELLTGEATRVEACPIGAPQDEASLGQNGITPWGPIQAVHQVTIGSVTHIVNQLTSPDPFTATYQRADGSIVVSNLPLDQIVFFTGHDGPQPSTVVWYSEQGDPWEVVPGRMIVYFDDLATEQDIQQLIMTEQLQVVMSWFEPADGPGGTGGNSPMGGADGDVSRLASSSASLGNSLGGGEAVMDSLGTGNSIAWFDFQFDPSRFTDVASAHAHFLALPHIASALPLVVDYSVQDYSMPNDPIFRTGVDRSRWIDAYNIVGFDGVPNQVYPGIPQYIGIIDDGVYRYHEDISFISNLGVDAVDHGYCLRIGGGEPDYATNKPGMEKNDYWHRLTGHGTQIVSLIKGMVNNGYGTPSLAPGATVLPIRMSQWTRTQGIPGVPNDRPTYTANAHVKAIRAMRFELGHTKWYFKVRVVNMSFSYPSYLRNIPWPANFPSGGFQTNLSRDQKYNDRLYIGGAGNDARSVRVYPGAYSNVLGVSALDYDFTSIPNHYSYTPRVDENGIPDASNYMGDARGSYPISGIYRMWDDYGYCGQTAVTPISHPDYNPHILAGGSDSYIEFSGTSAAAPQIAAIAYHRYSRKPNLLQTDYRAVWNRIVSTRNTTAWDEFSSPLRAPADLRAAITGW